MIQTGLIPNAHADLVTDVAYDFYGQRLATCSLDQRIKIWQLDEQTGTWSVEDDWRGHNAPIAKLSWAHPEFGTVIASAGYDRTVKIWEQSSLPPPSEDTTSPASRWIERAVLLEARGSVRSVEFAPRHFGFKLATISSDNHLRIYECIEQPSLSFQLSEETDIPSLSVPRTPSHSSKVGTMALATPTQTYSDGTASGTGGTGGASASLVAQALQQASSTSAASGTRPGTGNREADGGWSLSWCKDRFWGEVIAVACGVSSVVKVVQLSPSKRPQTILVLDPTPATTTGEKSLGEAGTPTVVSTTLPTETARAGQTKTSSSSGTILQDHPSSITSVAWAPSCGRSYHLVATGSRDGKVRIWKVRPPPDEDGDQPPTTTTTAAGLLGNGMDVDGAPSFGGTGGDEPMEGDSSGGGKWSATLVAEFDHHKSCVGRVEWNITGTVLSSSGNDAKIRLWKASEGGSIWRFAGSVGVEQKEDEEENSNSKRTDGDVNMAG